MKFNRVSRLNIINKYVIFAVVIFFFSSLIYNKYTKIENLVQSSNVTKETLIKTKITSVELSDQIKFSEIVQDGEMNSPEPAVNKFEFNAKISQIPTPVATKDDSCNYPEISNVVQFFQYGEKEKFCQKLVKFGGPKINHKKEYNDGEKFVCLDKEYNIKQGNCIVLSFGISNDWSFDDDMDKFGCKVYSFDPSIGLDDHNRSTNIRFYNLGLSDSKTLLQFGKIQGQVDRYKSILEMLNLMDSKIDYLKIDIEGTELNFFKDIFLTSYELLKNVKQIGMEIHPAGAGILDDYVSNTSKTYQYWHYMNQLECAGFKLLSYEKNLAGNNPFKWRNRNESECYEIVWGQIL